MNWISVKEKLPCENCKDTIIITDGRQKWIASFSIFAVMGLPRMPSWSVRDENGPDSRNVTHWIYLKDLPKPEKK